MSSKIKRFILGLTVLLISVFYASDAVAVDGVIDNTYKFAWGNYIGWVNFNPANGNVKVTDTAITGYAWNENYGWIKLHPANGGVKNDGQGNLSGKAWAEGLGWIDFSHVSINTNKGDFTGYANIENKGKIIFDCSSVACKVKTTWRPSSTGGGGNIGGGAVIIGGGSGVVILGNPPIAPQDGFGITINNGALTTTSTNVTLRLKGGQDTTKMVISNYADFHDAAQQNYSQTANWILIDGFGLKGVYAKFYNSFGFSSPVVSTSIVYVSSASVVKKPVKKSVVAKKPLTITKAATVKKPVESIDQGLKLLTYTIKQKPIVNFIEDYSKVALGQGTRDLITIKTAQGKILVEPAIDINNPDEIITEVVTGEILQIFFKPAVKSQNISGTLVFSLEKPTLSQIKKPLNPFPALVLPIEPDITKTFLRKIKIIDFNLIDENKDGVYMGELQMPQQEGKYEIVLKTDMAKESKTISLNVDSISEGYIYDKYGSIDRPLPGVLVSLFWKNPETQKAENQIFGAESDLSLSAFELWEGEKYNQENPQKTDKNGKYTFLTPAGSYYIKAEFAGYNSYTSNVFEQKRSGQPITFSIELKGKFNWFKIFIIFLAVALILLIPYIRNRRIKQAESYKSSLPA